MAKLILVVVLLFFSLGAQGQTLWRDVPVGTTVEKIKKLIPGAYEPTEPPKLASGAMLGLLEFKGFQLADIDFKATFFFRNGRLDRIFLNPVERPSGLAARVAAIKVRDGLLAKYGKPVSGDEKKGLLGVSEDAKWLSGGTIVMLMFNQYGDDSEGFLQVVYMAPGDVKNL